MGIYSWIMTGVMYRWMSVGEFREIDENVCAWV